MVPTGVRPAYNRILFLLALFGLMVAGYLWYVHITHADLPCGMSGGCEKVQSSRYATFPAGSAIPVAAYGAAGYLALAALAFLRTLPSQTGARNRLLLLLILLGAGLGTVFSLYLTYLELFVIRAICRWCVGSQCVILAIFLVALAESLTPHRAVANTSGGGGDSAGA